MFNIGDMVWLPADKHNEEVYGFIIDEVDHSPMHNPALPRDPVKMFHIEWFDGQKSYEFPKNIHKVQK